MQVAHIARASLSTLYVWFGLLKLFGFSPATPLVAALGNLALPTIPTDVVSMLLGAGEVVVGLLFLAPRFTRGALIAFGAHMAVVALPLIVLPAFTWNSPLVPTLEGQYILKNLSLIALGFVVGNAQRKSA